MRPCIKCGCALHNRDEICERCGAAQTRVFEAPPLPDPVEPAQDNRWFRKRHIPAAVFATLSILQTIWLFFVDTNDIQFLVGVFSAILLSGITIFMCYVADVFLEGD